MKKTIVKMMGLLTMMYAVKMHAMPTPARMQEMWKQKHPQTQVFVDREKEDVINFMKTSREYTKFEQLLQEDNIKKGWFEGPNTTWKNQVIISAFKLLDPSRVPTHTSVHTIRSNYIKHALCTAMAEYNKKCWFQTDTAAICSEMMKKLNNLIQYSKNPQQVEDTFANRQLYPLELFEGQHQ